MRSSAVSTMHERDLIVTVVITEKQLEKMDPESRGFDQALGDIVRAHVRAWRVRLRRRDERAEARRLFREKFKQQEGSNGADHPRGS